MSQMHLPGTLTYPMSWPATASSGSYTELFDLITFQNKSDFKVIESPMLDGIYSSVHNEFINYDPEYLNLMENMAKIEMFNKSFYNDEEFTELSHIIIERTRKLLLDSDLLVQPEVFPTYRGTIQFEYENEANDYFEVEIFEDYFKCYHRNEAGKTRFQLNDQREVIIKINEFAEKNIKQV